MCTSQEGAQKMPAKGCRPHWGKHPPRGSRQPCRAGLTPQGALSKATDLLARQDRTGLPPWSSDSSRDLSPICLGPTPSSPCGTHGQRAMHQHSSCMWHSSQPLHTAGSARPGELGPPFRPVSESSLGTIPVLSGPTDSPQQNSQARKALSEPYENGFGGRELRVEK